MSIDDVNVAVVAAAWKLRTWVDGERPARPSRDELRAWAEAVLDDRLRLSRRAEAAEARVGDLLARVDELQAVCRRLRAARDAALRSEAQLVDQSRGTTVTTTTTRLFIPHPGEGGDR
jgi:hypothetical protein